VYCCATTRRRTTGAITAPADLARLDTAAWGKLLREVDPNAEHLTFTANLRFETNDQRLDHFAQLLAANLERRYPTAAFAGRVVEHGAGIGLANPAAVGAFLDANKTLSLRRTHIDAFVAQHAPDTASPEVIADLKRVQRVYKLTPRFEQVKALLATGHDSAQSIYAAGRSHLVAKLGAAGIPASTARTIFARAEASYATALALVGNFNLAITGHAPAAVAQPLEVARLGPMLAAFPNLQSLFGTTDYCACEHCRAIHGPAAYLVDILEFLKARIVTAGTARDVLFARRADLGEIELSCANTTGEVPYVDLACEVLEDAIAAPAGGNVVRARQTSGTAEERRASPQFVNAAAYAVLRDAVFPMSAPFDLWATEVRRFLAQLGVPWHELLDKLAVASGDPTPADVAGERLGFDRRGLALVINGAPNEPWGWWGLAETGNSIPDPRKPDDPTTMIAGTWLEVLAIVPVILHRAGISHRELIQLLATRFINPTGSIRIVEQTTDGFARCDTGVQQIEGWTSAALSRFVQLVRVWRRLGCAIWDLDKLLVDPAVGNATLDALAIVKLRRVVDLAARLRLGWDELLGLWSTVDRFDYVDVIDDGEPIRPSVYARRFRNATVMQSSSVFVADPTALTGLLDDDEVAAGLAASLNLSSDNIQRIRALAGLGASNAPLDLSTLSVVYRHAVLAAGLRISIAELHTVIALTGLVPFADPESTTAFVTALDRARATEFSLVELDYLLRHGSALESGLAVADSTIAAWLEDLRKGLVRLGTGGADLVAQRISDAVALDPQITSALLGVTLPGGTGPIAALFADPRLIQRAADGSFVVDGDRASFVSIFEAYVVIAKLRTVIARWRVSPRDGAWLITNAGAAGWLALQSLPPGTGAAVALAHLSALRRNVKLQQALVTVGERRLFDVVDGRNAARDTVAAALAEVLDVAAADVIALADRFGWASGPALVGEEVVPRLHDALAIARKLGAGIATTLRFATTDVDITEARQARQLTKARYDLDRWYAVAGAISDNLREHKRAALVAWLLANPDATRDQRWFTVEQLYEHYLIDPEMTAVAVTTRIKQAAASVQLFVQRCLLQREPQVVVNAASDSGWRQWEWMKRFRLWEANRKIFLYPENWIDPRQRRNKSTFFKELEAELQQIDVTHDVAEDAVLNYLQKLGEVANLEISGVCEQVDYGERLLHVVARTRKTPHVHYYRRLGSTGVWSPWEKLDLEIDADHVMPVFWNRRLYVFWAELEKKAVPSSSADRKIPAGGGGTAPAPTEYWEITLAWAEKRRERWLPKRQARQKQLASSVQDRHFTLKASLAGRQLEVATYMFNSHYASWRLTSADHEPLLLHSGLPPALDALEAADELGALTPAQRKPTLVRSATTLFKFNSLVGRGEPGASVPLTLLEGLPQQDLPVLGRITQPRLMTEHQPPQFTSQAPFFLSDPQRTFFVTPSFVSTQAYSQWEPSGAETYTTQYNPELFYHPFAETFLQEIAFGGVDLLYARRLQLSPDQVRGTTPFDFAATYAPTAAVRQRPAPAPPFPVETIDYSHDGAYAAYNWELFFHVPLLVARKLADNQRFADALRWFHFVFDPTTTSGGTVPQRYWMPKVFHELSASDYAQQEIERLLQLVSQGDAELTRRIAEWRADPFDPHLIAASRPVAYQKAIVMQYIDTLIAWGDQLFRGDTIETINEATQLYLLASQLLGPRPQHLRALEPREAQTYVELAPRLDAFGNAMVEIENVISIPPPGAPPPSAPLPQLHTFYFCIPPNEKLLGYWDTVADRLFKIRHGLNIEGVARPLALYEPPIDPGLLMRALAAGLELSTVIADMNVATPCYRFNHVWQIAHDLCQDVRGLGATLLAAIERRDVEAMARLTSSQELALLDKVRSVKVDQLAEAKANLAALRRARESAVLRQDFYATREFVNAAEHAGLVLAGSAIATETAASVIDMLASASHALPTVTFGGAGFGGSPVAVVTSGGGPVGNAASSAANVLRMAANALSQGSSLASSIGNYQRRRDDWDLQRKIATKEIVQLDQQLLAAEIRIALAQHDLDAHDRQRQNATAVAEQITTRFANRELYDWFISQLSTTYFQAYQLAYDLAKRASKAYGHELGTEPAYIQFGYWDSLHKGLQAGDRLLLDLRRLQAEFLQRNRRELELTKHVSLVQHDPMALVRLRQTGVTFINLPEALFDLDQPGHYLRRLKTVSVSLPCVTGPYTTVNATLTLQSHAIRHTADPGAQYPAEVDADGLPEDGDPRFTRHVGTTDSVALSSGRDDAGMFEVNFHDERYLPFEGAGAISHWRLELPRDTNRFDVGTLTDVVLHVRYTAR
jgi:Tc toxin complex TcA C-terminal TcB-binding domain/Neuraminidase-like domain